MHTQRELHLVYLATCGLTDKGQAIMLGLKENTIRTRWYELNRRSGCLNRAATVSAWFRWHIAHGSTDATQRPSDLPNHRRI